jgi:hypothetical protein
MTDRELLELAAKAAGYEVRWHDAFECFVHVKPFNLDNPPTLAGQRTVWSPLTDDGDALRLAVKLRLNINFEEFDGVEYACAVPHKSHQGQDEVMDDDENAATRRAIVRAAAAIGEARP